MREVAPFVGASSGDWVRNLRALPMLSRVSDSTIDQLQKKARWLNVQEGEAVVLPGDALDKVYFVMRGELCFLMYTEEGKVVALREAGSGSFIGEAALVGGMSADYVIEASVDSTIAAVNSYVMLDLFAQDRELMVAVMRSVVDRGRILIEQVVELTTLSVNQRIQSELRRIGLKRVERDGSAVIQPIPTHSDLARRIGTHREAVSRAMSHLQYMGIVVRQGERLFIPDIGRLMVRTTSI